MIQRTRGIVLKQIKYSETSIVARIFTREYGLLAFMVPGVRTSKSRLNKASLFQPMTILELDLYYKETAGLMRLKEYRSMYLYKTLPFDAVKLSVGFFFVDVLNHVIHEHEPNPILYDFASEAFIYLDRAESNLSLMPHRFLLELSSYLGFYPDNNFDNEQNLFDLNEGRFVSTPLRIVEALSLDLSAVLFTFLSEPAMNHSFTADQRKQLLHALLTYFRIHIPNFGELKSVRVLEEIFR